MAYVEQTAQFSNAQVITATANATNVFDVTGAGVGSAPAMIGAGGVNTAIGTDIGLGDGVATPQLFIQSGTAGAGAGTLSITLAGAPDNGSYSEGTYTTLYTSKAIVGTSFAAGQVFVIPVPPIIPGEALPRFYRVTYTVSGSVTATLTSWLALNAPLPRDATLYGNNYISI